MPSSIWSVPCRNHDLLPGLMFWACAENLSRTLNQSFSSPEAALHQESRPLGRSNFLNMRRVIVLYSQPIRFVRLDSEHAQSDGKSVNRELPVVDLPRGRDSWYWTKGARPLETRIYLLRPEKSGKRRDWMTPCVFVAARSVQSVQEYRSLGWMKEVGRESVVLLQNTTHWG